MWISSCLRLYGSGRISTTCTWNRWKTDLDLPCHPFRFFVGDTPKKELANWSKVPSKTESGWLIYLRTAVVRFSPACNRRSIDGGRSTWLNRRGLGEQAMKTTDVTIIQLEISCQYLVVYHIKKSFLFWKRCCFQLTGSPLTVKKVPPNLEPRPFGARSLVDLHLPSDPNGKQVLYLGSYDVWICLTPQKIWLQ